MTDAAMFESLPDPLLLVLGGGETERSNKAARELAERQRLRPQLAALFGKDGAALLGRARRDGAATAFLPLRVPAGETTVHRVSIRRAGSVERFIVQLTDMSREFRWREQLGARNRELAVLNDIGAALSLSLDLDTLAGRIYEQASRILNTINFYIALHDADTDTISFPIRVENRQRLPAVAPRPAANGLTEHVIRTGEPKLVNGDVLEQARALGLRPIGRSATSSWLGVPLLAEGKALGVIALQDHQGTGAYDEHDLEVLTLIAAQAAAAIRNAQLLAQARSAYRELAETQANRLETERLRGIAETVGALNHEVNNPLTAIAGNAQLLLRQPESLPAGAAEKIERMLEAARRIQSVTARMANLIQATSMPYPGDETILDVSRSTARDPSESPADGGDSDEPPGEARSA